MKPYLLLPIFVTITSCHTESLDHTECTAIANKQVSFLADVIHADSQHLQTQFNKDIEASATKCVAGDTFNRDDYKCFMAANGKDAIFKCMLEANKHIKH